MIPTNLTSCASFCFFSPATDHRSSMIWHDKAWQYVDWKAPKLRLENHRKLEINTMRSIIGWWRKVLKLHIRDAPQNTYVGFVRCFFVSEFLTFLSFLIPAMPSSSKCVQEGCLHLCRDWMGSNQHQWKRTCRNCGKTWTISRPLIVDEEYKQLRRQKTLKTCLHLRRDWKGSNQFEWKRTCRNCGKVWRISRPLIVDEKYKKGKSKHS